MGLESKVNPGEIDMRNEAEALEQIDAQIALCDARDVADYRAGTATGVGSPVGTLMHMRAGVTFSTEDGDIGDDE